LAKKYAKSYKGDYDLIWWIDSDKDKNIGEQLKQLASEWNNIHANKKQHINILLPREEIIRQLKERLRVTELNWLLIFDNAIDQNRIKNYFPDKHSIKGYGHILITSKNPLSWNKVIELNKLTRPESIELLLKVTGEDDKLAAAKLADALEDFPLALVQATAHISSHPSINIEEYRELFLTKRKELWQKEEELSL
jgi:hypothetical protein